GRHAGKHAHNPGLSPRHRLGESSQSPCTPVVRSGQRPTSQRSSSKTPSSLLFKCSSILGGLHRFCKVGGFAASRFRSTGLAQAGKVENANRHLQRPSLDPAASPWKTTLKYWRVHRLLDISVKPCHFLDLIPDYRSNGALYPTFQQYPDASAARP